MPDPVSPSVPPLASRADRAARRYIEWWVVGGIVAADQITKVAVQRALALHDSKEVIPDLLALTHVRNTGAAFGILNAAEFPYKAAVMIGVAAVALIAIAIYAARLPNEERVARIGLALILGGAVGNLIDRARTGYVVDFVDVYWRGHHFWAFNVADAAISIGAIVILLDMLLGLRRNVSTAV